MGTFERSHAGEKSGFDYGRLCDTWYRECWYSKRTCIEAVKLGAARHGEVGVVFVTEESDAASMVD